MANPENTYCRLCAENKCKEKLIDLNNDSQRWNEVLFKLSCLNVDVSSRGALPKAVCFVCYEGLNKVYDFLDRVKKGQDVLTTIFSTVDNPKFDLSDDDRITALDDFLAQDSIDDDITDIKEESSCAKDASSLTTSVKLEPKEEDTSLILRDALENIRNCPTNSSFDQTLNVQDILDAALCNGPFTPNVTIYAKEISENKKGTWKDYPWICLYCNIEFLDIGMLRSHSKVVHGKCAAFNCVDCKVTGKKTDFKSFIQHVKKHRKRLRNFCHYCDERVAAADLKAHVKQHFLKSQVPCPSCGEILKHEASLQQHIKDYISAKPIRKPRRKAGTPITVEDLTCHICKKVYKNPNSLRDHLKRHTIDRKRNYTCDRCGKTFYNKGTLTSHIMAHDQIRPHICRICSKSFLFPNMLRRHVEMHSGVKPFSCEQCGRCFRLQYQLNAHKIVHTDSMPHVCSYCNKAFRFKQILKNHERQHTGAKPYCCQHCGMEFSNWSNYNKHMKRRHGTDTSKKKITPDGVFPINPLTGQIIQMMDQGMEEWKNKVMIPAKRGKKKAIKEENVNI